MVPALRCAAHRQACWHRTQEGHASKSLQKIKEWAQQHGPGVIAMLARLASNAESEAARVAVTKERRDRAYGRAGQLP